VATFDSGNHYPPELPQGRSSTPKIRKVAQASFQPRPPGLSKSESTNNGAFGSSLPHWRLFLSMLNWRRDPDHEQRMMQRRKEIEQFRNDTEQLKPRTPS